MVYSRIDLNQYVDIPVWYGCNNNCVICMLSGLKLKLPVVGLELFQNVIQNIIREGRYRNLILSGAEITTFDRLEEYLQYARSFGWFEKIQVQTNGKKLSETDYLRRLIHSGVNEFFISVHGLETVHDTITRTNGSFKQTFQGIRNLEKFDVNVITNTVLTKINFDSLTAVMSFLCNESVSELHIWNYCPMETRDSKDLLVDLKAFVRILPEITSRIKRSGKALVLKHFPLCLPIDEPGFLDNRVPMLLMHELFWQKFGENRFGTCIYKDACWTVNCAGLSDAYMKKYGEERNLLTPMP
jgi:MoaA/NifB/PqqE/SkfB family radical SAM enzyme